MQSNEANYDHTNGESDPKHRTVHRTAQHACHMVVRPKSFEETVQLGTELSAELYK